MHSKSIRSVLCSVKDSYYLSKIDIMEDFSSVQAIMLVDDIGMSVIEPLQENISLVELNIFNKKIK